MNSKGGGEIGKVERKRSNGYKIEYQFLFTGMFLGEYN